MATVPVKPTIAVAEIEGTRVRITTTDGSNGGAAITARRIYYSKTTSYASALSVASDDNTWVSGLDMGTKYYFWARTMNSVGWSDYSTVKTATTLNVPGKPAPVNLDSITENSVYCWLSKAEDTGGSPITGRHIYYSTTNETVPLPDWVNSDGGTTLTGLTPGMWYYIWSKLGNSQGWSVFSPVVSFRTLGPPYAPTAPKITNAYNHQFDYEFFDGDSADAGGPTAPITARYLEWERINPPGGFSGGSQIHNMSGTIWDINIGAAKTYNVYARTENRLGLSPRSAPTVVKIPAGTWIMDSEGKPKQALVYQRTAGGYWGLPMTPFHYSNGKWLPTIDEQPPEEAATTFIL